MGTRRRCGSHAFCRQVSPVDTGNGPNRLLSGRPHHLLGASALWFLAILAAVALVGFLSLVNGFLSGHQWVDEAPTASLKPQLKAPPTPEKPAQGLFAVTGGAGVIDDTLDHGPPSQADPEVMLPQPVRGAMQSGGPTAARGMPATALTISGRVITQDGYPVAGVKLTAILIRPFSQDGRQQNRGVSHPQQALTNADGLYTLSHLVDGEYEVQAASIGNYTAASIKARAGVEAADLVLREKGRELLVYGTVMGGESEPLAGVRVTPIGQSASAVRTDRDGDYEVHLVIDAQQEAPVLRFSREDLKELRMALSNEDVSNAFEVALDVRMEPVETFTRVEGWVVRNDNSLPIVGETVLLYSPEVGRSYHTVAEERGAFEFSKVEVASGYRLSIRPKGPYRNHTEENLPVTEMGLQMFVKLEPLDKGTLEGEMLDKEGNPIRDFELWLYSSNATNQGTFRVRGDQQGHYLIDDVPVGDLTLATLSTPQFSITGISMSPGVHEYAPLVLDWGNYAIRGRVIDHSGNPIAAPELTLSWFYGYGEVRSYASRRIRGDADGYFLFTNLGPGLHTILTEAPGFKTSKYYHEVGLNSDLVEIQVAADPELAALAD